MTMIARTVLLDDVLSSIHAMLTKVHEPFQDIYSSGSGEIIFLYYSLYTLKLACCYSGQLVNKN